MEFDTKECGICDLPLTKKKDVRPDATTVAHICCGAISEAVRAQDPVRDEIEQQEIHRAT